jgi:hypothetical protein
MLCYSLAHADVGACPLLDKRVCVIDAKLRKFTGGHAVLYEEVSAAQIKSVAETEWMPGKIDIIRVAESAQINLNDLTFLIAHEYAHSYLRHSRIEVERIALDSDKKLSDLALFQKYGDDQSSPAEFCHQQEFEADAFAVRFMYLDHKSPLSAIRSVIHDGFGSDTHPSKRSRLDNARRVLDDIAAKNTADLR